MEFYFDKVNSEEIFWLIKRKLMILFKILLLHDIIKVFQL